MGTQPARRNTRPPARASDADRERTVRSLREHYASGRLTSEELEERIAQAYEARDRSELRALIRDLPLDLRRRRASIGMRMQRAALRAHATTYGATSAGLVGIWAMDGGTFWPAGPIVGWGAFVAAHALTVRRARRGRAR